MISRTDPDRELYEARLQERRDKAAFQQASQAKALAERAEGRAEGRAEMRAEIRRADIHSLQKSLGREITPLDELQTLSSEEWKAFGLGCKPIWKRC
jgi:hypothetical protein